MPSLAVMKKVLHSWHSPDHFYCMDVFIDHDGQYRFELFRSDLERPGTWYSSDQFHFTTFERYEDAVEAAQKRLPW